MIELLSNPGETWYAQLWAADGALWNGAAMVAYNAADWATYAVALTDANGLGLYSASVPAGLPAGAYQMLGYLQGGASPAAADAPAQRQGELVWDGAAEVTALDRLTAADLLQTPANKIKTNAQGQVETSNPAGGAVSKSVSISGKEVTIS